MFGKVLGAIIGFGFGLLTGSWAAAWVLGLVGLYVGHLYDGLHADPTLEPPLPPREPAASRSRPREEPARPKPRAPAQRGRARSAPPGEQDAFCRHVCALFAEVARADGSVVREEVRVVRGYFEERLRYPPDRLESVRRHLKAAIAAPSDVAAAAASCRAELGPPARSLLLDALYELAVADGSVQRSERELLRRIGEGLGIAEQEQRSVARRHLGGAEPAYAILGVAPSATDSELRRAYRRLAALHHPDRVSHLGPGAAEIAGRRFREVQGAYEEVRRIRGL